MIRYFCDILTCGKELRPGDIKNLTIMGDDDMMSYIYCGECFTKVLAAMSGILKGGN